MGGGGGGAEVEQPDSLLLPTMEICSVSDGMGAIVIGRCMPTLQASVR
jgi:hypothetical protein